VNNRPDKVAVIWSDLTSSETLSFTFREISTSANQLVNRLRKANVRGGENMYFMIPLLPETWSVSLGLIKGGIIAVPTATTMTQRELEYRFESYPPDSIFAHESFVELIDRALATTNTSPKIKIVKSTDSSVRYDGWEEYSSLTEESTEAEAERTQSDDVLFCFFTSGTTGLPKRVAHTAISYALGHLSTGLILGVQTNDIHHNLSAPGWAKWAWSSFFVPFNVGATATGFHFERFVAKEYLEAVARLKISSFCAPPTAWRAFVQNSDALDFSNLRQSISAGEPLNPVLIVSWFERTGNRIRDFYGQTETTALIGNHPWMENEMKSGSFGKPSGCYDVVLVDDELEEIFGPDQVGNIAIRLTRWNQLGLFKEYLGNPDYTITMKTKGFYLTGDRATIDSQGFWWFVGRSDDVIKSSDYRIGPFEVESALMEHKSIGECAVIGVSDASRHQLVKAFVILRQGETPSEQLALSIFTHCINILAKFKIPRILEFVSSLPKTLSGKIRRVELRQLPRDPNSEFCYTQFPQLSSQP